VAAVSEALRARLRAWLPLLCAALLLTPAAAADTTLLDGYLQGLDTWSAKFTQDVRDTLDQQRDTGSGRLVIVRPGKFRLETSPGGAIEPAQLMIADGLNLWTLDYDLEQATVKPQADVLSYSPAMLLAGAGNLRQQFKVTADGRRDGFEWVRVQPTQAESDFTEALFGFRGRELARLVIVDKLGQRSTLQFTDVRRNARVDPGLIQFKLPEGVDLIGTPVKP
jgi:outer membrane lipoprotein carrier protein